MRRALIYAFMAGKGLAWIFIAASIFTETVWQYFAQL
jgi:hypothetical protein